MTATMFSWINVSTSELAKLKSLVSLYSAKINGKKFAHLSIRVRARGSTNEGGGTDRTTQSVSRAVGGYVVYRFASIATRAKIALRNARGGPVEVTTRLDEGKIAVKIFDASAGVIVRREREEFVMHHVHIVSIVGTAMVGKHEAITGRELRHNY